MSKPFLEIRDVDDDDQLEPLVDLAGLDAEDLGAVLASFRPWPTPRVWLIQLGFTALFGLIWFLPFEAAFHLRHHRLHDRADIAGAVCDGFTDVAAHFILFELRR